MRVRHRRGYRDKGPDERLNDRLFTSLYLGLGDNPLDARLGAGGMQTAENKRLAIPLHVMVPASKITFLPLESGTLANVTIEVAAKDPEKFKIFKTRSSYQIPEPTGEDDPLIDMVLNLELEPGRYVLAVAVRDEASQLTSHVSTSVEVSAPSDEAGTGP